MKTNNSTNYETEVVGSELENRAFLEYDEEHRSTEVLNKTKPLFVLVACLLLLILPTLHMCFGTAYFGQCPNNSNIPIYLWVAGVSGVTATISIIVIYWIAQRSITFVGAMKIVHHVVIVLSIVFNLFYTFWVLTGFVWVVVMQRDVQYDNTQLDTYCNKWLNGFLLVMFPIECVLTILRATVFYYMLRFVP